jgi:dipeptidyl aminopeptidase/acylaminoacyl peptidase
MFSVKGHSMTKIKPLVNIQTGKIRSQVADLGSVTFLLTRFLQPIFLLLVCLPAFAKQQSFTIEQVMSSPFPTLLVAAKTAPRIAWVFDKKGTSNVWVADGSGYVGRQITHYENDDGQHIVSLAIAPDGKTVVYARGSEINAANQSANPLSLTKNPTQQVWTLNVDQGETRLLGDMGCAFEGCERLQVSPEGRWVVWAGKNRLWLASLDGNTPPRQLTELRGDSSQVQWSPDAKRIAFRLDRKDHSFIVLYDLTSQAIKYIAPTVDRDMLPRWSPDSSRILFVRIAGIRANEPAIPEPPEPWALWVADTVTGAARQLWKSSQDPRGSFPPLESNALFFAAGNRVVFLSERDGRSHLYSIPATGGMPLLLTPGEFDVEGANPTRDRTAILYVSNQFSADPGDEDRRHIWRVSIDGGVPEAVTRGETVEWSPAETFDGTLIYFGSGPTSPAAPYRLTAGGREMLTPSAIPADFPSGALVVPQQVIFKSDDGYTIHGQLFLPPNRSGQRPALIFLHGGPPRQMLLGFHYIAYYHNTYAENEYLASRGYVVLSVNYRLGTMYGRDFREAPHAGWRGAAEYRDIVAGARYLQNLPYVDKHKIGLWGGSYGGYLTALGLARNSDIFSAGVDFHGVHDWRTFNRNDSSFASAPDFETAGKLAFDSSPNAAIETWKSPVLLIHGDDDRNVPFMQTTDLVQRLREHNVPFEELIFPDEIHDFLLWINWVRAFEATADFFDRKLR